MDFRLTDDQRALSEGLRDYLSGTHGPEVLRTLDVQGGRSPAVWQGLVDMGLTGLLIAPEQGGLGLGLLEGALVAEECGRFCVSEPLVDTACIAVPWLIAKGEVADLPTIAAGARTVPVPHAINPWVADGDGAPLDSVDPLRRLAEVGDAPPDDPYLLDLGAVMSAAQLLGTAEAMLAQAIAYSGLRHQFGQPIGAFQAIKHQLANCAVAIAFARPVVWRAADALDRRQGSAAIHVSHAKLAAGDAAMLTAETAIQVHGAMGYTYEVDLHFWMKRSWALCGAWGSRAFHLRRVDDALFSGGVSIGPDHSFA